MIISSWILLLLIPLFTTESTLHIQKHVPETATSVIKINNNIIFKRLFFDGVYGGNFTQNETQQIDFESSELEFPKTGIDWRQQVILFQESQEQGASVNGVLLSLNNPEQFASFEFGASKPIKYFSDDIGCLIYLPEKSTQEQHEHYERKAQIIINDPHEVPHHFSSNQKAQGKDELLELFYKGSSKNYIQNLQLHTYINDNSLLFEGVGQKNPALQYACGTYSQLQEPARDPFLEIRAGQLPDSVYAIMDQLMSSYAMELPPITSQQLMIYGVQIENVSGSTVFLPQFDGVFRFQDSLNFGILIDTLSTRASLIEVNSSNSISIGTTDYYYEQLSPKEVVIGISKSPVLSQVNEPPLPLMRGNPEATLNIQGEGIIAQFAKMFPPVKYSRKFFHDLSYFEFHTKEVGDNQLKITGEMRFPEEKKVSLEILKLMIKL